MRTLFLVLCLGSAFQLHVASRLRLENSHSSSTFIEGRLGVNHNGEWGTVCDDLWDIRDTNVACRDLGYGRGLAHMHLGEGSGRIWLDNLACTGSESYLSKCGSNGWGSHNCDHDEDIGIVCQIAPDVSVRLVGGRVSNEGRVEVRFNSLWGTVCDKAWTLNNAHVICKMLGYQKALRSRAFGSGSGQIWLDDVFCRGSEDSISKCQHRGWGVHNCGHGEDIGVFCEPKEYKYIGCFKDTTNRALPDYLGTFDESIAIEKCATLAKERSFTTFSVQYGGECFTGATASQTYNKYGPATNCANGLGGTWANDVYIIPDVSVRLSGGITKGGLVEVRYYGVWRSICDTNWRIQDARVICKMKGFSQGAVALVKKLQGSSEAWMFNLGCMGHESSIESCSRINWRHGSCANNRRAGVICKSGSPNIAFRLTSGIHRYVGRLEVRYYDTWGAVCSNTIELKEAHVVCRILGYREAITIYEHDHTGSMSMFSMLLNCTGRENLAQECQNVARSDQAKTCSKDVWVLCRPTSGLSWKTNLRLVGGSSPEEGRIEMQHYGVWGTICNSGWDIRDANILCRMLNFTGAITAKQRFGSGTGPIWLTGVRCNGNEKSIMDCASSGLGRSGTCTHSGDAGVFCHSYPAQTPNIAVRLMNGTNRALNQGRVEVRYYGVWGTVCDDGWGLADAHVVCRMLKYSKASWAGTARKQGRGVILLDDVRCRGNEKSLGYCHNYGWGRHNCGHSEDAAVKCAHLSEEEASVNVRLARMEQDYVGQVEVRLNETWIPVCDDTWDILDAHVVCRMLGYKAAQAPLRQYRKGVNGLWMGGVACTGDEKSISHCYHRGWTNTRCPGNYYAGVMCKEDDEIPSLYVRLENGSSPNSGRVAVRYGNVWGTICNRGLDINDAKVICRMLGYPGVSKVYPRSTYRPGNGTIWLSSLECKGTEKLIADCRHPGWGNTTLCSHEDDAAVLCKIADAPRFQINETKAITKSSVLILFNASQQMNAQLKSVYQVAVEKRENEKRFKSNEKIPPFGFKNVNATKAKKTCNEYSYIAAEIQAPVSSLTVGDGQYYHGYYNAPLEPGSMYRVHVRIVTMAMDGEAVHSHHDFVAFTTKRESAKGRSEMTVSSDSGTAIGLSLLIVILIGVIVAGVVWYFLKLRNQPSHFEGLEINRPTHAAVDESAEEHYQVPPALPEDDPETEQYVNTRAYHHAAPPRPKKAGSTQVYSQVRR